MKKIPAIAVSIIIAVLSGCGREYHVRGWVVVSGTTVSSGTIVEITGKAIPGRGTPVQGAVVTIYHELGKDGSPVAGSSWKRSVLTDGQGMFDLRDYAAPAEKILVGIGIEKPGYDPLYSVYWDYHDVEPQVFLAEMKQSH